MKLHPSSPSRLCNIENCQLEISLPGLDKLVAFLASISLSYSDFYKPFYKKMA